MARAAGSRAGEHARGPCVGCPHTRGQRRARIAACLRARMVLVHTGSAGTRPADEHRGDRPPRRAGKDARAVPRAVRRRPALLLYRTLRGSAGTAGGKLGDRPRALRPRARRARAPAARHGRVRARGPVGRAVAHGGGRQAGARDGRQAGARRRVERPRATASNRGRARSRRAAVRAGRGAWPGGWRSRKRGDRSAESRDGRHWPRVERPCAGDPDRSRRYRRRHGIQAIGPEHASMSARASPPRLASRSLPRGCSLWRSRRSSRPDCSATLPTKRS